MSIFVIVTIVVIIAVLLATAIFFFFPSITSNGAIPFTIQQRGTNNCISTNKTLQNNQQYPATIQSCGNSNFNQTFRYNQLGGTFVTILNNNNFCLDVRNFGTTDGTDVGIFPCNDNIPANQQFTINDDGTISFTINNTKKCISNNGANLKVATCNSSDNNQLWFVFQ